MADGYCRLTLPLCVNEDIISDMLKTKVTLIWLYALPAEGPQSVTRVGPCSFTKLDLP